jgi:EAL domain-containing protein (putative c-di-GMP-specific phosphodiesterase class I)
MADRATVSRLSDYAWSTPPALADQVTAGAAAELLYVHVPFGSDLEAAIGAERHAAMLSGLLHATRGLLAEIGCPSGVQLWPMDGVIAWVADPTLATPSRFDGLEVGLATALRDVVRAADLPPQLHDRSSEIAVSRHAVMPGNGDLLSAYARALRDARREACDPAHRELQRNADLMDLALAQRAFVYHYQPIVDCEHRVVFANEALCRGTLEGLRFPDVIFGVAERTQRVWELGRVLRDLVAADLEASPDMSSLLFMNVHPDDIDDPVFLEQALSGPLRRHASRVVVELTERAAIRDYRRVKAVFATLRRCGYRLAIDDLGSGYAGLTALAELEPDFIKFDMGLVRDLHMHPVKQRLIKRMHEFAIEIGAETISEGVETVEERDAVLRTGCTKMQGYLFARPAPGYPGVPADRFPGGAPALTGSE